MPSKNISFASIPSAIRKPGKYVEFNTALAVRTLPANRQRVLIVAQRTATGAVAAGVVTPIFSDAEAATAFGIGSLAHRMVRAAIKANPYLDLTVLPLDDNGATKATWTVTVANAATKAGALRLWVGYQAVEITVANGDAAATIAANLNTELAKYPDLPVTAGVAGAVVTLTARNAGTVGNQIDMTYELLYVTATTVVIANGVAGVLDPDLAGVNGLPRVAGEQYDVVISPYNATVDITKLITHLDLYSGPMEQKPGVGVLGFDGALASCTTITIAANSGRICMGYLRGTKSPAFELAAALGSVIASEEDPARPLNTLTLTGIHAPTVDQRLTRAEQESLLNNGAAPMEVQPGDKVGIVRAISTYTKDGANTPDISLLDITTIRTLDYVRRAIRERISLRFPREKLSSRTAGRVKGEILDVLRLLEELEIVEQVTENAAGVIVERDLADPNRLNAKIPTDIVNGLHVFAGRIDLLL